MSQTKTLVILLLMCFLSFSLSAQIEVVDVVPSDDTPCNGSFTVRANGTAGPFAVVVLGYRGGTQYETMRDTITDSLSISNFCNGNYQVNVFPARFPTCVTAFNVNLQRTIGASNLVGNEISSMGLQVSPNPTSGKTTVVITEPLTAFKSNAGEWTINITDVNGSPLEELTQVTLAKRSQPSFPIDLSKYPRGVYFIRVTAPGGEQESRRVVVQ